MQVSQECHNDYHFGWMELKRGIMSKDRVEVTYNVTSNIGVLVVPSKSSKQRFFHLGFGKKAQS